MVARMRMAHLFERRKDDDVAPSLTTQLRTTATATQSAAEAVGDIVGAIDPRNVNGVLTAATWMMVAVGLAACAATAYYLTRD